MEEPTEIRNRDLLTTQPYRWDTGTLNAVRSSLERHLGRSGSLPVSREDLIGEVLLRLLGSDPRTIESPAAYARAILRNLVHDKIRELQRAQRVLGVLAARCVEEAGSPGEPSRFEDGEFLRYLLDHSDLTRTQEKVIRMMYFEDLSVSQVARQLSRNPGTILQHHNRAIEKLSACASRLEQGR